MSSEVVFDEEIGNPFAGSGLVIHDAVTTLISEHDEMTAQKIRDTKAKRGHNGENQANHN